MKFSYNEDVSRILDYLSFPRIYGFYDEYNESTDDSLIKAIGDDYLEFAEGMHTKLEKYKDVIGELYQKDIYSMNDYYNILIEAFPVFDYEDEHKYLKDLINTDSNEFKEKMIKAMLTMEQDKDEVKDFTPNEAEAMTYINQLKIDSASKWNLLMMVQNPKAQLEKLIKLLQENEHIFYTHHRKYLDKMNETGERLAKEFSKDTVQAFKKITYDSIDYNFEKNESGVIYISTVFQHSLRLMDSDPVRMVWGLEMEKSFKTIHDINEDQLVNRVKAFKALGDKTRYETLKLLSQGMTSIKEIAETLDVSSATISYHINEFLTAGVLKISRGKEKKSHYKVDYDRLNNIIEALKEDLNFKK